MHNASGGFVKNLLLPILVLLTSAVFCSDNIEILKNNPANFLNSQDVPIFYTGSPLEGLSSFAVIPTYSIQSQEVNKKIEALIERELGSIGTVIKSKSEDVAGLGSAALLSIQIGPVSNWDGGPLPFSRITLNIETQVVISKTHVESLPRVWSINDFVDSSLDLKSEEKVIGPIQKLLKEFVANYKYANSNQTLKPIFYVYY